MSSKQYIKAIEESNIVSKTDIHGIITFVNDEFCNISQFSRDELLGRTHNIVRHPDVTEIKFKLLWDTINNKQTYKDTVKNRAKDGTDFYLNTTIIPILDNHDNIKEFIAIRYDVTNEFRLKLALDKKQKILFMQSRFASLGQMIANISHQWRQPLSELQFALFNLKKASDKQDNTQVTTYYKKSKKLIQSMSQTIEDFSNFFNPNKETVNFCLTDAIDDAIQILSNDIKNEKIILKRNFEKIEVNGIPNELTQVIVNLILNAKDAFISNSIKEQKIHKRKLKIRISKSYFNTEIFALIIIEDNAGGIPNENLEKIFEPYFTTKHSSVGTGIGLFMSSMIIQKSLHGTIEAVNTKSGAKFTITIPILKEI
jgi:PAS domain S-box-containing protein